MLGARQSVIIEGVYPELDCGRYPVKREVGDHLEVWADIFKEGHDVISASLKHREKGKRKWSETPMKLHNPGLDRWTASFPLEKNTRYEYTIEAWFDAFESWRHALEKKVEDGQHVDLELIEGRELVEEAAARSGDAQLKQTLENLDAGSYDDRLVLLRSEQTRALMARHPDRSAGAVYKNLEVVVDRVRARYGAWYEMFPARRERSPAGARPSARPKRGCPT